MKGEHSGVVILYRFRPHLEKLTESEQGQVLMAALVYDETGEIREFQNPACDMIFGIMREEIDKMKEHYLLVCERRRAVGALGGRPKNQTEPKETNNNQTKPIGYSENQTEPNESKEKQRKAKKPGHGHGHDLDNGHEEFNIRGGASLPLEPPAPPPKRFIPPTEEEVAEYMLEKGYRTFTAEAFVSHYQARNWTYGGANKKMADWRAACRTWAARDGSGGGYAKKPAPPASYNSRYDIF